MLKFQRNRTKPQFIRIFRFDLTQQGKRRSPIATEKHEQSIERHFGQKYPELLPENKKKCPRRASKENNKKL